MPGLFDGVMPPPDQSGQYPRKPSIVNRILQRLLPVDPVYGQMLTPEEQSGLQHQGLQKLGINLLRNFGPQPKGTSNFGSRLGQSLQEVDFPGLVKEHAAVAAQMEQQNQAQAEKQALRDALARNPGQPGESGPQTVQRLSGIQNELVSRGFLQAATQLTDIIKLHQGTGAPPLSFHASKDGTELIGLNAATGEEVSRTNLGRGPAGETELQAGNRKDLATRALHAQDNSNVVGDSYRALIDANKQKEGGLARDKTMLVALAHVVDPGSSLTIQNATESGGHVQGVSGEVLGLLAQVFGVDGHELTPAQRAEIVQTAQTAAARSYRDQQQVRAFWQAQAEAMIGAGNLAPGSTDFILGPLAHWGDVTFPGRGRGGATADRLDQQLPQELR